MPLEHIHASYGWQCVIITLQMKLHLTFKNCQWVIGDYVVIGDWNCTRHTYLVGQLSVILFHWLHKIEVYDARIVSLSQVQMVWLIWFDTDTVGSMDISWDTSMVQEKISFCSWKPTFVFSQSKKSKAVFAIHTTTGEIQHQTLIANVYMGPIVWSRMKLILFVL